MEYHSPNSSLDTLHILGCDEDIESDKYSSLESYIINYEEESQKKQSRHYKSKSGHRCRRDQRKENTDSTTTKVTQEIHVEKNFKCIINLNTTICGHENPQSYTESEPKPEIERIAPRCMRPLCHKHRNHNTRFHRPKKPCTVGMQTQTRHSSKLNKHMEETKHDIHKYRFSGKVDKCIRDTKHNFKKHRFSSKVDECMKETKQIHKHRHLRHNKKPCKRLVLKQNEPKLSLKKQNDLEFEDISTTSLDSYLEIPTSYKHVKNSQVYYESKLDTLIRRTKERERKLVEQSRNIPWYTSTPNTVSSVEFPMNSSEIDVSLNSRSTVILEPKDNEYSPSVEGICPSPTIKRYFQFNSKLNDIESFCKVKAEPSIAIEAYSPTISSDLKKVLEEQWIKKEIKIEPSNNEA